MKLSLLAGPVVVFGILRLISETITMRAIETFAQEVLILGEIPGTNIVIEFEQFLIGAVSAAWILLVFELVSRARNARREITGEALQERINAIAL